jgi:hypothetical protein
MLGWSVKIADLDDFNNLPELAGPQAAILHRASDPGPSACGTVEHAVRAPAQFALMITDVSPNSEAGTLRMARGRHGQSCLPVFRLMHAGKSGAEVLLPFFQIVEAH